LPKLREEALAAALRQLQEEQEASAPEAPRQAQVVLRQEQAVLRAHCCR
jgi:hypothetical protein